MEEGGGAEEVEREQGGQGGGVQSACRDHQTQPLASLLVRCPAQADIVSRPTMSS